MTKRPRALKKDDTRMKKYGGKTGFKNLVAAVFFAGAVSSASAQENPIELSWPVDCELGSSCWVARYMDRSIDKGRLDYQCGARTQDAHNGTDIAIADLSAMARGVNVKAAADGVVFRLRTGMQDVRVTPETRGEITKRGCGNIVILRHAGGWQTHYCHMKQGSIQVAQGDRVEAGQVIGQVGLSGLTEFPHLHFMVRAPRTGEGRPRSTDPFDGGRFEDGTCDQDLNPLWDKEFAYQPAAIMPPVIDSKQRTRATMWEAQEASLPTSAKAIIVQSRGFHTIKGDIWQIRLMDPDGTVRVNQSIEQKRDRQQVQAFAGLRKPAAGFKAGVWTAEVTLVRAQHTMGSVSGSIVVR
ncbi:MAG: M23 family metallopeptidase [Kordiimonadaceae bacterium]|nr:M23 family metallopeptidase [Kordiimonadaceae bacterium]MBO6568301.1 M23 family metallopeptidase [Kordiimonadaceae bacterium]MBO6963969.1 M23 family metallopeptidase [Kordiimonadaceae bacterium]